MPKKGNGKKNLTPSYMPTKKQSMTAAKSEMRRMKSLGITTIAEAEATLTKR